MLNIRGQGLLVGPKKLSGLLLRNLAQATIIRISTE